MFVSKAKYSWHACHHRPTLPYAGNVECCTTKGDKNKFPTTAGLLRQVLAVGGLHLFTSGLPHSPRVTSHGIRALVMATLVSGRELASGSAFPVDSLGSDTLDEYFPKARMPSESNVRCTMARKAADKWASLVQCSSSVSPLVMSAQLRNQIRGWAKIKQPQLCQQDGHPLSSRAEIATKTASKVAALAFRVGIGYPCPKTSGSHEHGIF
ncbi:hypothetical protein Bbelb_348850 [Branchiostoma belcheri]|nr:hypothetical protein Bbelb_348850 [Branchiostoma belcheri]